MASNGSKPIMSFSEKQEDTTIGKYLLVEINYQDTNNATVSTEQIHGTIEHFDPKEGITIKLNNSSLKRTIPLDASTFQAAPLGNYTLTTGEVVEDPDYTMILRLHSKK